MYAIMIRYSERKCERRRFCKKGRDTKVLIIMPARSILLHDIMKIESLRKRDTKEMI